VLASANRNRGGFGRLFFCLLAGATGATLAAAATLASPAEVIRVATWNVSLNRSAAGELRRDLEQGTHPQLAAIAAVVRRVDPDVLLVNEFDYDDSGVSARLFRDRWLPQFKYFHTSPSNTGVPSGHDLDNNGSVGSGEDAFGFGLFPGQYGMLLLSKYPIQTDRIRTFQKFRWRDMPGAAMPLAWYSADEQAVLRLSSKSHWDVPVALPGSRVMHLLLSHPTPPTFDGPEDRNGRRNNDEIRLWADYLSGGARAAYLVDDRRRRGGLAPGKPFVLLGDMNSDPVDGDGFGAGVRQLLAHPRVHPDAATRLAPRSLGAVEAASQQAGVNLRHRGETALDTGDFDDRFAGNLRLDYILPSKEIGVCGSGVFWPARNEPDFPLANPPGVSISDHHLVWMDIAVVGACPEDYRNRSSMPTGQ
jgi:hypothetical protein